MKVIKYPDGQINVQIDITLDNLYNERISSYEDLFILKSKREIQLNIAPDRYSILKIPCLFGQRSDRRFSKNESFGLKIITDFINSMNFNKVVIFDPHSDVSLALINNSEKESSFQFVFNAILDITAKSTIDDNLVLVSPDAGAYKKVFGYGDTVKLPVIAANKFRDLLGKVSLNILGDVKNKDCLIVDDLADGGYTFHVLATKLKEQGASKVYLYVSHAYFNNGFDLLKENIDHIYCTNSVKDIDHEIVTQYKII